MKKQSSQLPEKVKEAALVKLQLSNHPVPYLVKTHPSTSLKFKDKSELPRERLLKHGAESLSDYELLAILLRVGVQGMSVVELAKKVLHAVGDDWDRMARMSVDDFKYQFKGIGEAKAITILTALEIGRRRNDTLRKKKKIVCKSSRDIDAVMRPLMSDLPYEQLWVLCFTNSNALICKKMMSKGGVAQTTADVRMILKYAILNNASAIAIVHNHPSGSCKPSGADQRMTETIKNACDTMNLQFLDSLIVGDEYYSFADNVY